MTRFMGAFARGAQFIKIWAFFHRIPHVFGDILKVFLYIYKFHASGSENCSVNVTKT